MSETKQYTLLRKLLKTLGLSDERIDELIGRILEWQIDDQAEKLDDQAEKAEVVQYPYHLRDDFLSPAELNFYRVLQTAVSDWATIFVKVSLGDLFYAQTGDYGKNQAYRNKIDRKHVDFLLCHPQTVRPILGIELDDKSHQRPDRQKRDHLVDGIFAAAQLPLVHITVKQGYPTEKLNAYLQKKAGVMPKQQLENNLQHPLQAKEIGTPTPQTLPTVSAQAEEIGIPTSPAPPTSPSCPKCGADMVKRTAKSGANAGGEFWGCSNYPRCRGIVTVSGNEPMPT